MSKKSFLVAFNKQLNDLINKLNLIIRDNEDLIYAKNMFHVPLMTKETIYIENFYHTAKNYETHIMSKNEDFFINFDISSFFSQKVDPNISEKHQQGKEIWNSFEPQTKNALWQYVQVLYKLANKYYN